MGYRTASYHEGSPKFSLGTVMEEVLSHILELVPPQGDETLNHYMARVNTEVTDWRGYWRDFYSNSRCRHEVLGFVVGKLVDTKMKGSAATLIPPIMIDKVFGNSVKDLESF